MIYFVIILLLIYLACRRRQNITIRSIVLSHLRCPKETDKFGLWAFGASYDRFTGYQLMEEWNRLHSDKLILSRDSCVDDDIPKMIEIWKFNAGI